MIEKPLVRAAPESEWRSRTNNSNQKEKTKLPFSLSLSTLWLSPSFADVFVPSQANLQPSAGIIFNARRMAFFWTLHRLHPFTHLNALPPPEHID